ncbi:ribose ABC transporter permease [Sphaerochaeta halotolerans]|uniref:Ribose ABC transporter permease n=1 Tax=Sphaerochaeta halotolerans TaxID=2293840 RepID=A0A372MDB0_9SPIR|nr:ribose ABC transporter permease [Sphaerochaeta halotolerans]RFU93791.1 ribose ABC transporter permease [Sphaerochaeta halotolerans]
MEKKIDWKQLLKNNGILLVFFLIIVGLSIMSPYFLTVTNILNIIRQTSIYGIIAVGMTFVILTGGIDLSVGSILALSGAVAAGLMKNNDVAPLIAALVAIMVGGGIGLVNGLLITFGKIAPFVVTLGMVTIARGLTLIYTGGYPISGFADGYRQLGGGYVLGIPIPVIIFLATVALAWFILNHTRLGRYTYAIGGNEETVKLSGINVRFYKSMAYVIVGIMSSLSALILTARLNSAEAVAGQGYELDVIAAVVIGGTSLSGGRGSIIGTLIGALLIGTINNGMNLLGISPYFQQVVKGALIIGAVILDRLRDETN